MQCRIGGACGAALLGGWWGADGHVARVAPRYASTEKRYRRLIEITASVTAAAIIAVTIINAAIAAAGVQKRFGAETHATML